MPEAEDRMFTQGAAYERFMGRWSRLLAEQFVRFAGVEDGERVLDVGAGMGAVARAVEAATTRSQIVGIDPSQGFVAAARADAKTRRTRFEVGDAQALAFADASFDRVLALLVVNFIPEPVTAIAEMRRVTRPGGVVSACVWDYGEGMQSLRYFWDEAVALEPAAEPKDERHMKLSRKGELAELWRQSGFDDVREAALVIPQAFASFDDYWDPFLQGVGPAGAFVAALEPQRRDEVKANLRRRLQREGADVPFVLEARAWCVRGEVPKAE